MDNSCHTEITWGCGWVKQWEFLEQVHKGWGVLACVEKEKTNDMT